jgi:hypothetical protein
MVIDDAGSVPITNGSTLPSASCRAMISVDPLGVNDTITVTDRLG